MAQAVGSRSGRWCVTSVLVAVLAGVGMVGESPRPALALVISEIHYNPAAGDEALEFIEITNESYPSFVGRG